MPQLPKIFAMACVSIGSPTLSDPVSAKTVQFSDFMLVKEKNLQQFLFRGIQP